MTVLKEAELIKKANEMRITVLKMMNSVGEGHVTSCFSCTEIVVALYYANILRYNPHEPQWADRDRFILSKGHACGILYAILADLGYFDRNELNRCSQNDSLLNLLLKRSVPGAEMTTGSLGIGFGVAAGMALGLRNAGGNSVVISLLGDGECQEGSIWEAAMFASQYNLNNLIAIVDHNNMSVTDFIQNTVGLEPIDKRWEAFGWAVQRIDGHNFYDITNALRGIHTREDKRPLAIIADTVKGKGIDFVSNVPLMHGAALMGKEFEEGLLCLVGDGQNGK
jgi:transketolase